MNIHFPCTKGITFKGANDSGKIMANLRELNDGAQLEHKLSEDELLGLETLLACVAAPPSSSAVQTPDKDQIQLLWKASQRGPEDDGVVVAFLPVLDILRLAVRHPQVDEVLCGDQTTGKELVDLMLSWMKCRERPVNQLLALRILCNCFSGRHGRELLLQQRQAVLEEAALLASVRVKNIPVALATLVLNYAGLLYGHPDVLEVLEAQIQCLLVISAALESEQDSEEALYRLLVALGTTLVSDEAVKGLAQNLGVDSQITKIVECNRRAIWESARLQECCRLVLKELQ